jgi:putative transposase
MTVEELQRRRAGCQRGSIRYRRLTERIARIKARETRVRRESLHEWSTAIAREFRDLEIIAPASIKETTASGHGTERDWGAATELKARFNRHVLDQAPAMAIQMLEYKIAEGGGATTVEKPDETVADIGNLMVQATKANRKLKRRARCTPT